MKTAKIAVYVRV